MGLSGSFAFAKLFLPNELSLTQTISFSFKTTQPHGILAYSYGTLRFVSSIYPKCSQVFVEKDEISGIVFLWQIKNSVHQ